MPDIPKALNPQDRSQRQPKSWRDVLPIHPAAELIPPMPRDELLELGADIKKNGQKLPVVIMNDSSRHVLLDGRSRLDAMEAVGIAVINDDGELSAAVERVVLDREEVGDPYDYVISTNIHRRHLITVERAALINLAADLTLFRTLITTDTDNRNYQVIWRKFRARYGSHPKKPQQQTRQRLVRTKPRMTGLADLHRRTKLGDATVDQLKGTSLGRAREQEALVDLNRGAAPGELKPIVKQLVDDAAAGKNVSAIEVRNNGVPPPCTDVGCKNEKRRLEMEILALRAKVEELKAERAKRALADDGLDIPANLRRAAPAV